MDHRKAPTAIHGPSGIKCHPLEKDNAIADAWKSSSHHMTCVLCYRSYFVYVLANTANFYLICGNVKP
jgi:hypothetical protein